MASSFLRTFILVLVIFHVGNHCLASRQSSPQSSSGEGECNIQNLNPLEPRERIQHEAGYTEIWDENEEQLQCVGAAVSRHVIQNKGLLVPSFNNAPSLVFVIQGRGVLGTVYPGCPETFQTFQQRSQGQQEQEASFRDQHQKIQELRQGDVIALEAGVAHWAYNEANDELVLLVIHDLSNRQNQLDQNIRRFFFAGNHPQGQQGQQGRQPGQRGQEGQQGRQPGQRGQEGQRRPWQQQGQREFGFNIFQALDAEVMSRALGVRQEVFQKIQNPRDSRGFIIRVKEGLRLARPFYDEQQHQQRRGSQDDDNMVNGFEETICTARNKENLMNPERADIYTAEGGSISTVNGYDLPLLRRLRLSAGRGRLRPNAMVAPHWNINAHSISFITKGSGRAQIVGQSREPLFDGQISQNQLLIVPQTFLHFKQAGQQGLEWVTLKTNDNARISPVVGKTSVFRGVPLDVWVNVYQLRREEARSLKYNRDEVTILHPQFRPEFERHQGQEGQQEEGQQGRSPWSIL